MDTEKSSHVSECKENETTRGLRLNIEEKKKPRKYYSEVLDISCSYRNQKKTKLEN